MATVSQAREINLPRITDNKTIIIFMRHVGHDCAEWNGRTAQTYQGHQGTLANACVKVCAHYRSPRWHHILVIER
ncbi:hypothetical protein D3C75_570220 [compost metagenome]